MKYQIMNRLFSILLLFILFSVNLTLSSAINLDSYLKSFFRKSGITLQTYNSLEEPKDEYKNLISSDKSTYSILINKKFDNLLFFCDLYEDINTCFEDLFLDNTINYKEININSNGLEDLIIYNIESSGRNIYLIPTDFVYSTNYSNILTNYFDNILNVKSTDNVVSFDNHFNFIIEIITYLLFIVSFYICVYVILNFKKIKIIKLNYKRIIDFTLILSTILLLITLLFQPLLLYIYKNLYRKSFDIGTFKSFYITDILNPKIYTSLDLVIYFIQLINIFIIVFSLVTIIVPLLYKYFYTFKVNKKAILLIFTSFSIVLLLSINLQTRNNLKSYNVLFENNNFIFNKEYTLDKNSAFTDLNVPNNKQLYINNYLVSHPEYKNIINDNLININFNNNYHIISSDLDESIKSIFYLNKINKLDTLSSLNSNSNIKFYKNLSYNTDKRYYANINLICNYETVPFTFSLFIYNEHQIESMVEPEKINFYNFPGCSKGDIINLTLPIKQFNLFKQDSIFVLRSREQEANKSIDTNGINYTFDLLIEKDIVEPLLIIKEKGIMFKNIISKDSKNIYNYSLSNKLYLLDNDNSDIINLSNIIKELSTKDLIKNTFTISTKLN